jgi:aspartate carbamoyltransferase catalytic subunit
VSHITSLSQDENKNIRHVTGINDLSLDDIDFILNRAKEHSLKIVNQTPIHPTLKGKVVINLFFENSTRTRTSFELATKKLGGEVINWDADSSSLSKGESFNDTIQTLSAMCPDAVIMRHSEYGAPEYISKQMSCPVINAGDSWREHPSQALLDAYTIKEELGNIEKLTIGICGDIAHSRVAHSNINLLSKLGANIHVIAPEQLMPANLNSSNLTSYTSLKEGLKGCDVIMTLRIQKERLNESLEISDKQYHKKFGITSDTLLYANNNVKVMHPGPMNRGIEISDDVADDPEVSLILKQVKNGVPVRMALLERYINLQA